MGRRKKIIGPTSCSRSLFGVHPVGIKNAVISPQARNAPMLGITIPARNPPNRWTLVRHPPVAAPVGTGIAVDIRAHPLLLGLPLFRCRPSLCERVQSLPLCARL